jgi:hypothetical protein
MTISWNEFMPEKLITINLDEDFSERSAGNIGRLSQKPVSAG